MNVLSFGGGVQTVAITAMCINGDLPKPDYTIFADPGWESKKTYEYIDWFKDKMQQSGMPLIIRSKGNIRKDALSGRHFATMPLFTKFNNNDGMLRRQCTSEYKVIVVKKAIRELLGLKKGDRVKSIVNLWLGISTDEATRLKPSWDKWIVNKYPLIDAGMSRSSCISYLKRNNIPVPPKSACIGCPFHDDGFWRDMKRNSPDEFEDACSFDDAIRTSAMKKISKNGNTLDGITYLHHSRRPLREVNFSDDQIELWDNECEGHCGL